jgi:hypothetical protein
MELTANNFLEIAAAECLWSNSLLPWPLFLFYGQPEPRTSYVAGCVVRKPACPVKNTCPKGQLTASAIDPMMSP